MVVVQVVATEAACRHAVRPRPHLELEPLNKSINTRALGTLRAPRTSVLSLRVDSLFYYNIFLSPLSTVHPFHWQAHASILLGLDSQRSIRVLRPRFPAVFLHSHRFNARIGVLSH